MRIDRFVSECKMEQADAKVEINNSNARRATVTIYYYYHRVYLIIVNLYTTYTGLLALIFMNSTS